MKKTLISALTLSLIWFHSPNQLLAQRKPATSIGSIATKPATTKPSTANSATIKSATTQTKQNVYHSDDSVPAAAGTYIVGAEKVDKVLEPARNHSYDTVYVSTEMTTYLIFSSEIRLLDLGSKNYAGRIEQNKLLLKPVRTAVPPSAMMIETNDGQIYLHYIAYSRQPKRIFWDYRASAPAATTLSNSGSGFNGENRNYGNKADPPAKEVYSTKLAYLKKQKRRKLFHKKENNIALRISGLAVDNTATYMLLQIDNQSSIPYKLEYVSFTYQEKRKRKQRRKVASEENQVLPMLAQTTDMIGPHSSSEMAYAFPLFANTLKGKLQIIVRETDGNRVVRARVPAKVLAKTLYIPNTAISYKK
ncbi:DUF4138 domain-containing protein [Cytophagaceae bacterium YF14B1]|uniref:DUF4138 domain-containing protein n=1 Tax=Xanthocytophaga flava TaxID=3048013 RepID=A0AAE3UAW2_9BACT|nr:DUF4138 domain-containing protein [Xanthocytophaga flavus]MDJ1485926.1 DUF4138 domain-containing protein [Xanthocytophaga flavus]